MLRTLAGQVGQERGDPDGVIVFDPSGFPKQRTKSVRVAKQWCGRFGKVDNCQVGVYMGYVTRKEHAIVNIHLNLNEDWAKNRSRRKEAGVPKSVKFQNRHHLALEMLAECGGVLPHTRIAGDDEMGRPAVFARNCVLLATAICLRSPRTQQFATSSRHRRRTPEVGHSGSLHSCTWINGARPCRRR